MKFKALAVALIGIAGLASCSSSKSSLPYFTDIIIEKEGELPLADYTPTIKPDDKLTINISSEYPEATSVYQPTFGTNYLVDNAGNIHFPVLGTLHVAGMTLPQLQKELYDKISEDVKDPVVDVRFSKFAVSVGGEVKEPKLVVVEGNRISILDALVAAGDLTQYGDRSNVLVIREEDGKRTYTHLNLNSSDVLTSPYYYLRQNDYVYVAPNNILQDNSKYNQNNAFKLSVISTVVSAASVIASLIIALAIK